MKKQFFTAIALTGLAACGHEQKRITTTTASSSFITVDTANRMISSYLNSIHASTNDTDLYSIIVDADSLRKMLDTTNGIHIKRVKLMLAHKQSYVNSGLGNTPCGYSRNGLTIIIAGYDANGDYTYQPANSVLNNGMPCPTSCPVTGTASGNLLTPQ